MNESRREVKVNSRNFDGTLRRSWQAEMVGLDETLVELVGIFALDVEHPDLGYLRRGTVSYEYYWLDRWYNVFRFHEPSGEFRNYYCNINLPPTFEDFELDYVDLDIDVLIDKHGSVVVLDEKEFEENIRLFSIPSEICDSARRAVDELTLLINEGRFPFDRYLSDYL